MESCLTNDPTPTACATDTEMLSSLNSAATGGTVSASVTANAYTLTSVSATNNTFTITKSATGFARTCNIPAGGSSKGGCSADGAAW
jgi:hypothetical protein